MPSILLTPTSVSNNDKLAKKNYKLVVNIPSKYYNKVNVNRSYSFETV